MTTLVPQPEINFDHELPAGREWFTLRYLAKLWNCSEDNVQRLIDNGDLKVAVDIAPGPSVKAMQRVHRSSVIALLDKRRAGEFERVREKEKKL